MPEDRKSYVRTVQSGNERLQFVAVVAKLDASFYVLHQEESQEEKDGKKVKVMKTFERGASQRVPTMEDAVKLVDQGVEQAVKDGWTLPAKVGGGGVKTTKDAFSLSALPKPKAAKPAAPIKKP